MASTTMTSLSRSVALDGQGRLLRPPASNRARAWRRFRANRLAVVALFALILLAALALAVPLISEHVTHAGPTEQHLVDRFKPISRSDWLGTDEYGRDVMTRIAYGGRVSLGVAALASVAALLIGTLVGS